MDTKLKSIKQSTAFKFLCLMLGAAFIALSACRALSAVSQVFISGDSSFMDGKKVPFYETGYFRREFNDAAGCIFALADYTNGESRAAAIEAEKSELVEKGLAEYKKEKAGIIRGELEYAVENNDFYYGEEPVDDEVYEDGTDAVTRPVTVAQPGSVLIQAVQALTCSDEEILKYENLVREDAFCRPFDYELTSHGLGICLRCDSFLLTETQVKALFEQQIDGSIAAMANDNEYAILFLTDGAKKIDGLLYYAAGTDGKKVFTNSDPAAIKKEMAASPLWFSFDGGKVTANLPESYKNSSFYYDYNVERMVSGEMPVPDASALLICLTAEAAEKLEVSAAAKFGESRSYGADFTRDALLAVLFFAAAVVLLVALMCLCGHKNGVDGIARSFIDKVPGDIHLILSFVLTAGLLVLTTFGGIVFIFGGDYISDGTSQLDKFAFTPLAAFVTAAPLVLNWLVFAEWLASVVRLKKSGGSWFKSCSLVMLFRFIFRAAAKFFGFIGRKLSAGRKRISSVFRYKPGHFKRSAMLMAAGAVLISALLLTISAGCFACGVLGAGVLFALLFAGFTAFTVYKIIKYINSLDALISAAAGTECESCIPAALPPSLKSLSESIGITRDRLNEAVNAALRDERMKTELITNVSHDIKTPLTSIINYVDLLKKNDIVDETARGYLDILDEKSARLKSLVEDLVEASKASSGAVTLNLTAINLKELSVQLLGEMSEDFEASGLDTVFDCSDEAPVVFADGQKTCRIIVNLLTNARKYSLPGTRVYVTLSRADGFGTLQVKNISRDPLNISADELLERFVRGDKARTDGGSGLGLSIARDLCALQGGTLKLEVDGDLFKATVSLPEK